MAALSPSNCFILVVVPELTFPDVYEANSHFHLSDVDGSRCRDRSGAGKSARRKLRETDAERMDGVQRSVAPSIGLAALSPDGRNVAFTQNENPRELQSSQMLSVVPGGPRKRAAVAQIPRARTLKSLEWMRMETPSSFRKDGRLLSRPRVRFRSAARPWPLVPGIQRVAGRNENSSRR